MTTKKFPAGGNLGGHNSTAEDPYRPRNFGSAPRVGQSGKPYSGGNAHGKHEKLTKPPAPGSKSGTIPLGGPFRKEG